jgi:hypothetical protein
VWYYIFLSSPSMLPSKVLESVLSWVDAFSMSSSVGPCSSSSKTGSVSIASNLVLKSPRAWVLELDRRRALLKV